MSGINYQENKAEVAQPLPESQTEDIDYSQINAQANQDRASEAYARENEAKIVLSIREKLGLKVKVDRAKEMMGESNFFGPEKVKQAFGIEVSKVPSIPYSAKQLQEAKSRGEKLVLRVNETPDKKPLNLKNLIAMRQASGQEKLISGDIEDDELGADDFWGKGAAFLEETPKLEWKLVNSKKIEGTEHLSYRAQQAIINKNFSRAAREVSDTTNYWKEIWGNKFEKGPGDGKIVMKAVENMPDARNLQQITNQIPKGSQLPTTIEAIYDHLLHLSATGKPLLQGKSVATSSVVPPMKGIDDNIRPWDIGFDEKGGVILHMRRSDRMGRPNALGNNEAGVSISYTQH